MELTNLPPEILLEIYTHLPNEQPSDAIDRAAAAKDDWALLRENWCNEEHPVLQSLRGVNRRFNGIFSALLFESVVMLHHPSSWQKINDIATSWLAPFVKTLRVATHGDLPVYPDIETWEAAVPYELERTSHDDWLQSLFGRVGKWFGGVPSKQIRWENLAAGGAVSNVDVSSRDKAYALYKYWANGEAAMRAMGENEDNNRTAAPTLRLDLLPNLKRFETVGQNELVRIKKKLRSHPGRRARCWIEQSYASRRSIEASLADQRTIPYPAMRWLWKLRVPPSDPASRAAPEHAIQWGNMKLLSRAITRHDIQITDLTLWDPQELGEISNISEIAFPSLRRLKVKLGSEVVGSVVSRYSRASWISKLDSLQELVVVGYKPYSTGVFETDDIIGALHGARFPKLLALEVRNIRLSLQSLEEFVQLHSGTLRSLYLVKPRMLEEEWIRLQSRYLNEEGVETIVSTESTPRVVFRVEDRMGSLYTPILK